MNPGGTGQRAHEAGTTSLGGGKRSNAFEKPGPPFATTRGTNAVLKVDPPGSTAPALHHRTIHIIARHDTA